VGVSENDFSDFYHDDPGEEKTGRKFDSKFLTTAVVIFGSFFFFQTTFAGNISLNSGTGIEFGQGVSQAVACSGNTNLTMTPRSTFINGSPGAHYLQSVTVSNIPISCYGYDFTISAYDNSNSTPLALFNTTSTAAVVYNNSGTFSGGIGSTGMTVASSTGTFTATFTAPVALASNVFKVTIQSGAHTTFDEVVDYEVGDRGPGGGIVYYVSASNFTSTGSICNTACKYLEVAPATWQSAGASVENDANYAWSSSVEGTTGQNIATAGTEGRFANEKFNWKIGQGFYNTSVMKVDGATSAAQAAVLAYAATDSSAGQWFIPSTNELNELCKYARGQTTGDLTVKCVVGSGTFKSTENVGSDLGGFVTGWYWSSSEWVVHPQGAWYQSFRDGSQDVDGKSNALYLRPIRAF
jgi:hypothetical protein